MAFDDTSWFLPPHYTFVTLNKHSKAQAWRKRDHRRARQLKEEDDEDSFYVAAKIMAATMMKKRRRRLELSFVVFVQFFASTHFYHCQRALYTLGCE